MIASTLEAISNAKYAGLLEKQANSMDGLLQRITNQFKLFQSELMDTELYDYIKGLVATVGDYTGAIFDSIGVGTNKYPN
jgi:hypothetical protein